MNRRLARIAALLMLFSLAATSVPVVASDSFSDYSWDGTGWVDQACYQSHTISVWFYQDAGYAGFHTRVCSNTATFCLVPLAGPDAPKDCFLSQQTQYALNDNPSSLVWLNTAACMSIYSDANYGSGGGHLRLPSGSGQYYRLSSTALGNDTASSMKVVSADKC